MEQALEKVFDQCLMKHGITDVAHSDMVVHLVCNKFKVWQWLDWAAVAGLDKQPWLDGINSLWKGGQNERLLNHDACHIA